MSCTRILRKICTTLAAPVIGAHNFIRQTPLVMLEVPFAFLINGRAGVERLIEDARNQRFVEPAAPAAIEPTIFYVEELLPSVNQSRLEDMRFPTELVPDKYCCEVEFDIMDDPVLIPTSSKINRVWDRRTLAKHLKITNPVNPYNPHSKLSLDVKPDDALKREIQFFVYFVEQETQKLELTQSELTDKDFETIRDKACQSIADYSSSSPSVEYNFPVMRLS